VVAGKTARARLAQILVYGLTIVVCAGAVIPFLWMVSTSFKPRSEIYSYPPVWVPHHPTLSGYAGLSSPQIFAGASFFRFAANSFFVAATTAVLTVTIASLAAYSMSRFRLRGSVLLRYTILLSQMLPGALLLVPLYLLMRDLRLLDTHWSLIIAYTSFTLPYCAYILKGYLDTIPTGLDEAAMVDGCNRLAVLFRVVLPLAAPGIAVTTTSAFILGWNEYMFALVFLNTYAKWTLPVALGSFQGQYLVEWNFLFAGATLVTLPVLVLFLVMQRWLAAGLVGGAIKA